VRTAARSLAVLPAPADDLEVKLDSTLPENAFEVAAIGMAVVGLDGRFLRVNRSFAAMVGREQSALVGAHASDITHPDDVDADRTALDALVAGDVDSHDGEKRYVRPDGTIVWARLAVTLVRDGDEPSHVLAQTIDISERKVFEEALATSEERFRSLSASAPNGIYAIDIAGRLLYANDRLVELTGLEHDRLAGSGWLDMIHPDERERVISESGPAAPARRLATEFRIVRPDGAVRWVRTRASPLYGRHGEHAGFVGALEDVTQELEAVRELAAREAEYRMLAENSSDFLARHAPDGTYRYASPASVAISGYEPDELVGTLPCDHIAQEDQEAVVEYGERLREQEEPLTITYRVRRKTGELSWLETIARSVRDEAGVRELVSVTRDVSERKEAELELSHAALHDSLTGLPNRALFLDRLGLALRRTERRSGSVAVLFCDLDRFKIVNDSLGHDAGDRLLVDVANRIGAALRPADTVARFGGDEFTILCEDIAGEIEAATIAQRIVDVFREPFQLEDGEVFLATSLGIAIARGADDRAADLIRDADAAMYRAKERGKGRYEIFDEAMRADAVARLETESALRRALERGELRLHYQLAVDLASGAITGFEALIRWEHPRRGLLGPGAFIPLAEETGLIVGIGEWVLHEACRQAARWSHPLMLSVNLSARELAQPDLVATVRRALAETGIDPANLCLEITESAVMESGAATTAQLRALKSLGVQLAIDDFGTGFSSLAHLRRFPVDILKIDGTFIAGLGNEPQDASIAAAVISLAHALDLRTVAEGIETDEQLDILRGLGCDLGQGYLFARPAPAAEALRLVGAQ
jgi:diguanylate cyclase (GGDEF)-like protein/PAS domain S-box-containing protein